MKAQVSIRVASVVAGVALAGCASTDRDGFRGFTNVEGVDGGKRSNNSKHWPRSSRRIPNGS